MSENQNTPVAIEESAIKQAADALIRQAAAKNGMTVEQVPEQAKQDAYNYARNAYVEEQALKSNPLWAQLEAERAAHAQTKKTLEATQQVRPQPVNGSRDTGPDPVVVRAQMGEGNWRALTDNGRLQACNLDPNSVTQVDLTEAKRCFGRGTDTHYASNLSKQDWGRYKRLKRIAIVLGIQGQ